MYSATELRQLHEVVEKFKNLARQKHVIAAKNISSRRKQAQSLMPDPTAMGLSDKDLANLTEYLLTIKE